MPTDKYPSIDFIRQVLRYEDGKLFWRERPREHFVGDGFCKNWNSKYSGKEAGITRFYKSSNGGRCVVTIKHISIFRYTIIWAFHHNEWRLGLDHKNHDSLDDRIENLRPASPSQNTANSRLYSTNKTGYKGVVWRDDCKYKNKYIARIRVNQRSIHIGCFGDPESAHAAYMEAAKKHFGEFASDGK